MWCCHILSCFHLFWRAKNLGIREATKDSSGASSKKREKRAAIGGAFVQRCDAISLQMLLRRMQTLKWDTAAEWHSNDSSSHSSATTVDWMGVKWMFTAYRKLKIQRPQINVIIPPVLLLPLLRQVCWKKGLSRSWEVTIKHPVLLLVLLTTILMCCH